MPTGTTFLIPGKFDVLEQDWIDRQRPRAAEQQRIAVGFRSCDRFQGDSGAAARPIVDYHRLPKQGRKLLSDLSRDNIHSAAGQEWNDDLDRSGRIRLCQSGAGRDGAESNRCHRGQQDTLVDHVLLPVLRPNLLTLNLRPVRSLAEADALGRVQGRSGHGVAH